MGPQRQAAPGAAEDGKRWPGGWIKILVMMLLAAGFLTFGIQLLIAAYDLDNPLHFLLTFFSANLIILISTALLVGFGFQVRARLRGDRPAAVSGNAAPDSGDER